MGLGLGEGLGLGLGLGEGLGLGLGLGEGLGLMLALVGTVARSHPSSAASLDASAASSCTSFISCCEKPSCVLSTQSCG